MLSTYTLNLENHLGSLPFFYMPGAAITKSLTDVSLKISGNPEQQIACGNSKSEAGSTNNGCMSTSKGRPFFSELVTRGSY